MDVLNPSPVLALPRTMWVLHRSLQSRPELSETELQDMVCPPAVRATSPQQGAHAKRALLALKDLRLVTADEGGLLRTESLPTVEAFVRELRRRVVSDPTTFGSGYAGAPDLNEGLTWLLRQVPTMPLAWADNVQSLTPAGPFENDTRWNGFVTWSGFLGFSRPAPSVMPDQKGSAILANPVAAVLDVIQNPMTDGPVRGKAMPMAALVQFLREELPVLPGSGGGSDGELGAPLAFALLALEHRGVLEMKRLSDSSAAVALPDPVNPREKTYVSTVTIRGRQR